MKSWPKVKLGQVQVSLNITQNHSSSPKEVISGHYWSICPNSHEKLTKSEIRSIYYFLQFGFIYLYLTPKYHICPYLALLTYIYHY